METKRRPILTVYEVKRSSLAVLTNKELPPGVMVADHTQDYARLIADVNFIQMTMGGPIERNIRVDLFANGQDHEFTNGRGIEIKGTVLNTRRRYDFRYSILETPSGISYFLRRFEGERVARDLGKPVGVNYVFNSERVNADDSIYRDDLVITANNREYLDLIEGFTFGMLKKAGITSLSKQ